MRNVLVGVALTLAGAASATGAGAVLPPTAAPAPSIVIHGRTPWAPVAHCESGRNWRTDTGNGYFGGLQFSQATWDWTAAQAGRGDLVGAYIPATRPRDQIAVAKALAFVAPGGGLGHWPACGQFYGGCFTRGSTVCAPGARA